jgi:transposase
LICELDAERDQHLATTSDDAITTKVTALSEIYGIGDNFAAVLAREVFYRRFGNRKRLASYVGLTPMPHQSCGSRARPRSKAKHIFGVGAMRDRRRPHVILSVPAAQTSWILQRR